MAQDGECITEVFYLIAENPNPTQVVLDLPASNDVDCCEAFRLKALASSGASDSFKDDVTGFIRSFNDVVSASELKLYKNGIFLAVLTSATYGTDFPYGFFTNEQSEKFVGYQLEWKKVLLLHGEGVYQIKCEYTISIGGSGIYEWLPFCLQEYTPENADNTVKIEYYENNVIGSIEDDLKFKDYGSLNWYNSLRLNGMFGFPETTYTIEYTKKNSGELVEVEKSQEPEFGLELRMQPQYIHDLMRIDVMDADSILITDYNSINPAKYIQKSVKPSSDYSPEWNRGINKLADVEVKFTQRFNNLDKKIC